MLVPVDMPTNITQPQWDALQKALQKERDRLSGIAAIREARPRLDQAKKDRRELAEDCKGHLHHRLKERFGLSAGHMWLIKHHCLWKQKMANSHRLPWEQRVLARRKLTLDFIASYYTLLGEGALQRPVTDSRQIRRILGRMKKQ
jgi:hypothetical protein